MVSFSARCRLVVAQVAAGELRWERRGAVLVLALQFQPGTAAILGIAVAIGVGGGWAGMRDGMERIDGNGGDKEYMGRRNGRR